MKKGGGKKNAMNVNGSRRSTRNSRPSVRKSAVIKAREDANAAIEEKKARRNAREAKKTAKGELVKRVNNLANLFSSVRVKAKERIMPSESNFLSNVNRLKLNKRSNVNLKKLNKP